MILLRIVGVDLMREGIMGGECYTVAPWLRVGLGSQENIEGPEKYGICE